MHMPYEPMHEELEDLKVLKHSPDTESQDLLQNNVKLGQGHPRLII